MVLDTGCGEEYHPRNRVHECDNCWCVTVPLAKLGAQSLFSHSVAACCNEAFKIATSSAAFLNNYFMLIGTDGVYSYTFEHEKRDECPVCGGEAVDLSISPEMTLEDFIELLTERQDMSVFLSYLIHTMLIRFCVAKSRNLHFPRPRSSSTSRHHRSWNKLPDRTLRRRCPSLSLAVVKLLSLLQLCHSVCLFASSSHRFLLFCLYPPFVIHLHY